MQVRECSSIPHTITGTTFDYIVLCQIIQEINNVIFLKRQLLKMGSTTVCSIHSVVVNGKHSHIRSLV